MFSFFKDREDSSDNTLSRLSGEWKEEKTEFNFRTGETEFGQAGASEIHTQSMFPDTMFRKGERVDEADKTLTRLSNQWSGSKNLPIVDENKNEKSIKNNQITALETKEDGVSFHRIDEEVAPSLLVDWKLWGLKLAIFIIIPMSIVLGGGAKHISKISPMFGEFCHNQALIIQEAVFGKDSVKVADNHSDLAEIYYKKKEYNRAIDHAHSASKIYVFQCLTRMYKRQRQISKTYQVPTTYRRLKPTVDKLRKNLILLARSSSKAGYHNLANKYWLMVLSIEPEPHNINNDSLALIKMRMEAAYSLARQRHYSEATKCFDDAFQLVDLGNIKGLYSGSPACYTEHTFEEMRHLIMLHQKRSDFFNLIKSNRAYKDLVASEILQEHLINFIAKRELDRNWVPDSPFMRPVYVSSWLKKGYITEIRTYRSSSKRDAEAVEKCILKTLNGSKVWKKNDTAFSALSVKNSRKAKLRLQFQLRTSLVNDDYYKQVKSTPLFSSTGPDSFLDRDIKQNIIEISKNL